LSIPAGAFFEITVFRARNCGYRRFGTGKKGPEDEGENKKIIRLPYQKVRREDSQRLLEEKEKK